MYDLLYREESDSYKIDYMRLGIVSTKTAAILRQGTANGAGTRALPPCVTLPCENAWALTPALSVELETVPGCRRSSASAVRRQVLRTGA
jgi:hypothetical protein